jgi:hypothetical protein
MRFLLPLVAALSIAAPVQPVAAAQSAAEDGAMALARQVSPTDLLVRTTVEAGRQMFALMLSEDSEAEATEKEHPGLTKAIWDAVEPELRRVAVDGAPDLWNQLASLYRQRLTPGEIASLGTFYGSPTGRKMIESMYSHVDGAGLIRKVADDPDAQITAKDLSAAQAPAIRKALEGIGPEDEPALLALQKTVSLEKLKAVGQEVQQVTLAWANKPDPASEARVTAAVEAAVQRHIAKAQKER